MTTNSIKKIEKIKNVRNFLEFSSTDDFGKKNIIYAPNGIGKTNLSRFIECISDKTLDLEKLKSLESKTLPFDFKINFKDGTFVDQNNYSSLNLERILVYNSDYIEKNVRSLDFSNKEIDGQLEVELGPEQAKLVDLENQLKTKESELEFTKKDLENNLNAKISEIKEWDPRGRLIEAELVYSNLSSDKYSQYLLNKENKTDHEGWINAKENFDQIKDLNPENDKIIFNINELKIDKIDFSWIKEKLTKKLEFDQPPTGEIKEHIEKITNNWIRSGLILHSDDKDSCPFCLQKLTEEAKDIIQKYKTHIESEKAKFEEKIDLENTNLSNLVDDLEKINNNIKILFDIRIKNLNLSITWQDLDPSSVVEKLKDINKKLGEKKKNPEEEFTFDEDYFEKINEGISTINSNIILNKDGIEKINKQLTDLGLRQTNLRKLLSQKYLVEFYDSNKSLIEKRNLSLESIKDLTQEIDSTKKKIPSKDMSIKIIDLFNVFINQIGIKKYKAGLVSGKIILKLNDTHDISYEAKNILSEGEKNAIALSYFLASSIRKLPSSEKFSDGIFVIDDPVCSMGYKYFYGICDVLKSFSKTIQVNALSGNESSPCPQIILLTHNVQFYNMLVSNIFKYDTDYFELEKEDIKHNLKKVDGNKLSEYKTALKRVKRFSTGSEKENIGNDIRRVLETLCNFHGYKELNQENITKILPEIKGSLLSFANDCSHEDINNYEDPFDGDQYKEMAVDLIQLMDKNYSEILKDL